MPLPLIIGALATGAGALGISSGILGGKKMKDASDTMKLAQSIQKTAVDRFESREAETTRLMDALGTQELKILESFNEFSAVIEKIQGRPKFKKISKDGIDIPEYTAEELRDISVGAEVLLGGIGGAAAGTAGGFAAAGATTAAVMALGTASTGTAISTLTGVTATNATLAALGGGSLAAGGGGMALGSAILSGATLGVGLLVGGVIFNITGSKLSGKADEALDQALKTENEVNKILVYFDELNEAANEFKYTLRHIEDQYRKRLDTLDYVVNCMKITNWNDFSEAYKVLTENTVLLVGLLYNMCKVQLVLKSENEDEPNRVNKTEVDKMIKEAHKTLKTMDVI